jgi:hypothetical protein
MEIQWKHVFLAMIITVLLVHLAGIINTASGIISDVLAAIDTALQPFRSHGYRGEGSSTYALARLCVFLIFIVGVLKLIKNWGKK